MFKCDVPGDARIQFLVAHTFPLVLRPAKLVSRREPISIQTIAAVERACFQIRSEKTIKRPSSLR